MKPSLVLQPRQCVGNAGKNSSRLTLKDQHTFVHAVSIKSKEPRDSNPQEASIAALIAESIPPTIDAPTASKNGSKSTDQTVSDSAEETYTTLSVSQVRDLSQKIQEQEKQVVALFHELRAVLGIAAQSDGQRQRSAAKNKAVLDEIRRMVRQEHKG